MIETGEPVYENEMYAIYPNHTTGYKMINKKTNVWEASIEKLPSAITTADVTCDVLKRILAEKGTD